MNNKQWQRYVDKYGLIIFYTKLTDFQADADEFILKGEIGLFGQDEGIQETVKQFWTDLVEPLVEVEV